MMMRMPMMLMIITMVLMTMVLMTMMLMTITMVMTMILMTGLSRTSLALAFQGGTPRGGVLQGTSQNNNLWQKSFLCWVKLVEVVWEVCSPKYIISPASFCLRLLCPTKYLPRCLTSSLSVIFTQTRIGNVLCTFTYTDVYSSRGCLPRHCYVQQNRLSHVLTSEDAILYFKRWNNKDYTKANLWLPRRNP